MATPSGRAPLRLTPVALSIGVALVTASLLSAGPASATTVASAKSAFDKSMTAYRASAAAEHVAVVKLSDAYKADGPLAASAVKAATAVKLFVTAPSVTAVSSAASAVTTDSKQPAPQINQKAIPSRHTTAAQYSAAQKIVDADTAAFKAATAKVTTAATRVHTDTATMTSALGALAGQLSGAATTVNTSHSQAPASDQSNLTAAGNAATALSASTDAAKVINAVNTFATWATKVIADDKAATLKVFTLYVQPGANYTPGCTIVDVIQTGEADGSAGSSFTEQLSYGTPWTYGIVRNSPTMETWTAYACG